MLILITTYFSLFFSSLFFNFFPLIEKLDCVESCFFVPDDVPIVIDCCYSL